jgi:hypothetical protein
VAAVYFPRLHPLVVAVASRAGVVAARSSGALSVQWVFGGTQAASDVLTVMIYWSTSARMSATANLTVILIIMRYVVFFLNFPNFLLRIGALAHLFGTTI